MACTGRSKCYTVFGIGVFCVILSIALILLWPILYNYILTSQLSLSEDSKSYEMWKETPIPMYLDLYLFNWTNSDQVKKDWTIKPKYEELGPYVFAEKHKRVDLIWNKNKTVTFKQIRSWTFQPHLSKGDLNDNVTNINVIAATVAHMVQYKHYLIRRAVDFLMREKNEHLVVTHTVDELLFSGYEDKLLTLVKNLSISGFDIPYDKFGWFYGRDGNANYDGVFNMFTGEDDFTKLGMVERWNYMSNTGNYPSPCDLVEGTTGELWPPVVGNKTVKVFASDMCSSVVLNYSSIVDVQGIEGSQYTGQSYTFENGDIYPEHKCFNVGEKICPDIRNTSNCNTVYLASGVRNVSKCRFGAPAFLSFPHFYLADKSYQEAIDGMRPNKNDHEFNMQIEANTGIPLGVQARIQINILVQPINGITMFKNAKRIFMPTLWFTQRASLTDDLASQLKLLLTLKNLGIYTGYGISGIGVLLLLIAFLITFRQDWKSNEGDKLLSSVSITSIEDEKN